jgi:tetratricopeptide (TPR) repeat protein
MRAPASERWATVAAVCAILLAGLWAYRGSFSAPFTFDDEPAIVNNPSIRDLGEIGRVLAGPPEGGNTAAGRPVVNLSLAVNYAVGGLDVRGYHAVNLAIHLLAALTLFGLVRRTLRARPALSGADRAPGPGPTLPAFFVALLWALHPLQTECVTFIAQRAESMMGLLYLLTLYGFVRGSSFAEASADEKAAGNVGSGRGVWRCGGWFLVSGACCLFGMGTKEVMASAPLIVLLYDRTFVSGSFREALGRRRIYYALLAATWLPLAFLVIRAGGHRSVTAGFGNGVTAWSYALTQCRAIALYLKLAFWPHPLVFDYGTAVATGFAAVAPQAALVLLLLAGTAAALWRRSASGFAGAWFFLILAPSSSFVPIVTQTMAEHRMYLPLAAVISLAVCGGLRLLACLPGGRVSLSRAALRGSFALALALAAALACLTARRNEDYRSALSLWEDTLAKVPGNPRAHYNLGVLMDAAGRRREAVDRYREALKLDPSYAGAHVNLGIAWMEEPGRLDDAISEFQEAIRLKPDLAAAHNDLGGAWERTPGRLKDAVSQYEEAVRLDPDFALAHYNLAHALLAVPGRLDDAIAHFAAAARLKPGYVEAHLGLAVALLETGARKEEAEAHLETVLGLQPANSFAKDLLSEIRASQAR